MIKDKNLLASIISIIKETAETVKGGEQNDVTEGMLIAYSEVLNIFKAELAGEDLKALGLNYDVDSDLS